MARAAYRWSVDVSVYIHANLHRSGIGRGLYTNIFSLLHQQGFYNLYAGITLPNDGSVGLHEWIGIPERLMATRSSQDLAGWEPETSNYAAA